MSSAIQRLTMLHSHIKDNSGSKLNPEFPYMNSSERQPYLNSTFQSIASNPTHGDFASSVIKPSSGHITSSLRYAATAEKSESNSKVCKFDDSIIQISLPTKTKIYPNLEFGEVCLRVKDNLRLILGNRNENGQACLLFGVKNSGWDFLGSNIVQYIANDVLCICTGSYSKSLADYLNGIVGSETVVTILEAAVGESVSLELIRNQLEEQRYGTIVLAHTDNSTGIITDIEEISTLVNQVSPDTIIAVDASYSAGVEEIQFDNWGIDIILGSYQNINSTGDDMAFLITSSKAISNIPGLTELIDYYDSLSSCLREDFQLLSSMNLSLLQLIDADGHSEPAIDSLTQLPSALLSRFSKYKSAAEKLRNTLINDKHGISMLSKDWKNCSNGMTAFHIPNATDVSSLLTKLRTECDVTQAVGTHPQSTSQYIRIEHPGIGLRNGAEIDLDQVAEIISSYLETRLAA